MYFDPEQTYESSWFVCLSRIELIRKSHTDQLDLYASYRSTWSVWSTTNQVDPYASHGSSWSVRRIRIKLIYKKHTDQVDPYDSYGSTWSVRGIQIDLIRMCPMDQLDPQEAYRSSWSVCFSRTPVASPTHARSDVDQPRHAMVSVTIA